jgi:8-oxo-dGTP pyrophosphatase MutT (NUDIX family)
MTAPVKKRHRHLGVYGILHREGQVLMIHKGGNGPFTGFYDLPGGSIEEHEQIAETVVREFAEETGLLVGIVKQLGAFDVMVEELPGVVSRFIPLHHIGVIYEVERVGGELNTVGDNIDSCGAVWMHKDELTAQNTVPLVMHVLRNVGVIAE